MNADINSPAAAVAGSAELIAVPKMFVHAIEDADRLLASVEDAAARAHAWLLNHSDGPRNLCRRLKFETVGFHPTTGAPLNLLEQTNQTWSLLSPSQPRANCYNFTLTGLARRYRNALIRPDSCDK